MLKKEKKKQEKSQVNNSVDMYIVQYQDGKILLMYFFTDFHNRKKNYVIIQFR